ncbi:MAG: diguanylate cyclase domain-containing protein [Pleomorphochaeta sp.]
MNKIKKYILFFILLLLPSTIIYASNEKPYNVLLLNSYHVGYKWSDEIYTGISTIFEATGHPYNIDIEYMDTQRITNSQYLTNLYNVYSNKYENSNYDVIISSDDAAYNFLREHGENLFGTTPIVFCGVNSFNPNDIENLPRFTGVVETYDISKTIQLALNQNSNIETIYYINDDSLTGKSIMNEFAPIMEAYSDRINFEKIDGSNYQSILNKSNNLEDDSIVLFLIYFVDRMNNYYSYDESISMLYDVCNRPIYGIWDFLLGHGIIGGKLVSGYKQGTSAAKQALEILNGKSPNEINVITEDITSYEFDYNILNKFDIPTENLPTDSKLINIKKEGSSHILILHSYDRNLQWTKDIEKGLIDTLDKNSSNIKYSIDYMDEKQHPEDKYQIHLYNFLAEKYYLNSFDLVITTDDAAFNFITTYSNLISDDTPIFFCGVNNKIDYTLIDTNRITGIIEINDYKSTIEIMKEFHPDRNKIIVINDKTITGRANKINLEEVIPDFENDFEFEFIEDINMNELLLRCENLTDNEIILLLSFTKDRSFNDFSYDESLELISEHTEVPIYGLWDFYLGNGIVGGSLKSGYTQGTMLGEKVSSYLSGTPISLIPIEEAKLDEYKFDYEQLETFNIPKNIIPKDSTIINKPFSLVSFFENNILFIALFILILLIIIIVLMWLSISLSKKVIKQEKSHARTDKLTGIYNRRACFEILEEKIEYCKKTNTELTICFADINKLKYINDNYGHEFGDLLIKTISEVYTKNIRNKDFVCRLGGDEFLFIFPETNNILAQNILDSINAKLRIINSSKKYSFVLSFSYGFASYDSELLNNVSSLINYADKKMYEHKIKQKNNSNK